MFFGKYYGTLKGSGMFWLNPPHTGGKVSLKIKTLDNDKQKINDSNGNPILIDTVVLWRIVDTTKAFFDVDNYIKFLSVNCDSSLRSVVAQYPYDSVSGENSLRGNSEEIATKIKDMIQEKVKDAGIEVREATPVVNSGSLY
ncbi:MAG: SPFH domain-containing protein [Defluviitaleaceae bacterium]|nr:SPFH domain-containing protein [Defluviitaleaceae bacterium]